MYRERYISVHIWRSKKSLHSRIVFNLALSDYTLEPVRKAHVLSKQIDNISGLTLGYKLIR